MSKPEAFLAGGGEMGALMRAHDWSTSLIGPPAAWPQSLRTVVRLMLTSNHPMFVFWGPEHICLYNDAYQASIGPEKHPQLLGAKGRGGWDEIWHIIGPQIDMVMAGDGATWHEDALVPIIRHGGLEEVYWTYGYSPIDDEAAPNGVGGVLVVCSETTARVLNERRQAFRIGLEAALRGLTEPQQIALTAARMLGQHLGVGRAGYGEVDDCDVYFDVAKDWTDGAMPTLAGRLRLDDFGPDLIAEFRAGRTARLDDPFVDARTEDAKSAYVAAGGMRAGIATPLIKDGRFAAAFYVHQTEPRRWSDAEQALVEEVAERTWLAVEQSRAEATLRLSETNLRLALEAGRLGTWTLTIDGLEMACSALCKAHYGRDPGEPFTYRQLRACVHPEDKARMAAAVQRAIDTDAIYDIEYRIRRPDGRDGWVLVRGQTAYDGEGAAQSMSGVSLDITERKLAEQHLRLMVNELNHRVKNTLATIQAVASQTLRGEDVPKSARDALTARLLALSRAHDVLTDEQWAGADLGEITAQAAAPFRAADGGERIVAQGPPLHLPPKTAIALALALHELATNAAKYGALSTPDGRVMLSWTVEQGDTPSEFRLTWREVGGPPVKRPTRKGFGTRLIQKGLAAELDGRVEISYPVEGVICTIEADLSAMITPATL